MADQQTVAAAPTIRWSAGPADLATATAGYLSPVCFSLQADLVAGVVLAPIAVLSLREVRTRRELPFALLPTVFCVHQLIEALVWLGLDGRVPEWVQAAAALAYVLIALPLLPLLVPTAILLLEPRGFRARTLPFVGLGVIVAAVLLSAVLDGPIKVVRLEHALSYDVGLSHALLWIVLYVVAVTGPAPMSGYRSIVAFGVLNVVGLTAVALLYAEAFASLWCVYAALTSVLILVHMRRRRRLPDPHRLDGEPHEHRRAATNRV
ncbi:MAG: DUF6629 family protein [Antricoccus sp.]